MGGEVNGPGPYDVTLLMRCCGPAGAESPRNGVYRIKGDVYLVVGEHRGSHQTWSCLENIETGERKDYADLNFDVALEMGKVEELPAMEALALAAKGPKA